MKVIVWTSMNNDKSFVSLHLSGKPDWFKQSLQSDYNVTALSLDRSLW